MGSKNLEIEGQEAARGDGLKCGFIEQDVTRNVHARSWFMEIEIPMMIRNVSKKQTRQRAIL